jgi:hypothetical protein
MNGVKVDKSMLFWYTLLIVNRPKNSKELFNLRHASLRNAIERIFGVLKKRFPILKRQMEFDYDKQVALIMALCCLHNFIRLEGDGMDDKFDKDTNAVIEERAERMRTHVKHKDISKQEQVKARNLRDKIADDMWRQYSKYQEQH